MDEDENLLGEQHSNKVTINSDTSFSTLKASRLEIPTNFITHKNIHKINHFKTKFKEEENNTKYILTIKIIFCIIGIIMIACMNNFKTLFTENVVCMNDNVLNSFFNFNSTLKSNVPAKNAILIIGGLLVDLAVLSTAVYFALYGKSWRFIVSSIMFYGIRALFQLVFLMKKPSNYIFSYPGFPSLFVSYLSTNDFFFSGHVGFPLLCGYEARNIKFWFLYIGIFISIYMAFLMFSTSGHYSIDIYFGFIFVIYAIRSSKFICEYLDKFVYIGNKDEYPQELECLNDTPNITIYEDNISLSDSIKKKNTDKEYIIENWEELKNKN